jgi:mannose-6-phosphate isomerase-like protein (cupin superfamily)
MQLDIQRWTNSASPDRATLQRQLESEGYIVTEYVDAAGTVYESHSHEVDQTHWIVSGELEFKVEGTTYRLRAGDRDFLPARTDHSAFVPGNEPVRYLIGVKDR